jgi:hypothetical protein
MTASKTSLRRAFERPPLRGFLRQGALVQKEMRLLKNNFSRGVL